MNKNSNDGYTDEFKKSSVKLALESNQSYAQTARELGVTLSQVLFTRGLINMIKIKHLVIARCKKS